jgi:septal ring factor EnvC (AmiA/AmiB activator)
MLNGSPRKDTTYARLERFNEDIGEIKKAVEHSKGTLKAIDAAYSATIKSIIDSQEQSIARIEAINARLGALEKTENMRLGRESFLVGVVNQWPLILLVIGFIVYHDNGGLIFGHTQANLPTISTDK